jgi:hypothetical protein
MNNDNNKKNSNNNSAPQNLFNIKGIMEFIKEEVKSSTSEWVNEKQNLIVS